MAPVNLRNNLVILLMVLLVSGCAPSTPTSFYLLTAAAANPPPAARALAVRVGPIDFPAYLDVPQIAARRGLNELTFSEFHRWAEPLKDNFSAALLEDLRRELGTNEVFAFPTAGELNADCRVQLTLLRLDEDMEHAAVLTALWQVLGRDDRPLSPLKRSEIKTPAAGEGYPERVAALSAAVASLSREIAAELLRVSTPRSAASAPVRKR